MKKVLWRGVALSSLLGAMSANAADLPPAPSYKAPVAAPASSWTGFYAGVGLGFRATRTDVTVTSVTQANFPLQVPRSVEPLDGTAFRVAPNIGFNWQVAPQWVVGVEGDFGFANQTTTWEGFPFGPSPTFLSGLAADSFAIKTTWDASARGRLGFLVTPTTLVYATGGAAWQHFDVTSTCVSTNSLAGCAGFTPAVVSSTTTKAGWTIGGGIETALWGNWLLRGEYRYADFGSSSFTIARSIANPLSNPTISTFDLALRTHTATFGLNYKFGDPVASANPGAAPSLFPVKAPPAVASWTGPYLGLGLGSRTSRTDATTTSLLFAGTPSDLTDHATGVPLDGTGFRAAPYIGWNWQVAPQWVVGVEGDFAFANQTATLQGFFSGPVFLASAPEDTLAVKTTWDASARGRIGFLVTPATLVYATGGAAWQHFDMTSSCVSSGFCQGNGFTPAVITNSTTKAGWTVGGGVETALWSNWLARAEYRYADFGSAPFTIARSNSFNSGLRIENLNVALRTHTATFGIAYKFN